MAEYKEKFCRYGRNNRGHYVNADMGKMKVSTSGGQLFVCDECQKQIDARSANVTQPKQA